MKKAVWGVTGFIFATFLGAAVAIGDMASGTVSARLQDGSGTKVTSTGAALDVNLKTSAATVTVTQGAFTTFSSAQQAVTGSAAVLATNTAKQVCVKALIGNTIPVYIGATGVLITTGMELQPGDSQCLAISNTNLVFVVASTTGASVSYDWLN